MDLRTAHEMMDEIESMVKPARLNPRRLTMATEHMTLLRKGLEASLLAGDLSKEEFLKIRLRFLDLGKHLVTLYDGFDQGLVHGPFTNVCYGSTN